MNKILKLKIGQIYFASADKGGTPYVEKYGHLAGKPKQKVSIYATGLPNGAKSCSTFASEGNPVLTWKKDDEVVVEVTVKGEYVNFSPVSENVIMLLDLRERVERLEGMVILKKPSNLPSEEEMDDIAEYVNKPKPATLQEKRQFHASQAKRKIESSGEPTEEEMRTLFGAEI